MSPLSLRRTAGINPAARCARVTTMNSDEPFGLFLTWTCYGTWLPGDPRGHVANKLRPGGSYQKRNNRIGTPHDGGDSFAMGQAKALQKHETVWLNSPLAARAAESMLEAAQRRNWRILRAAVMANHVHVVVMDCPDHSPSVRRVLKGVSQAALTDLLGHSRRWWTQHGSDRYLHGEKSIEAAINYVANQRGVLAEIVNMQVIRNEPQG